MAYVSFTLPMADIAKALQSEPLDELLNELGYSFDGDRFEILDHLEKSCGAELSEDGKKFLFALADFADRQFPGER